MDLEQDVLTTGQVAKICNVAPRTVSKWFDSGQLRGYRIPGSKDRRIPADELVRFMTVHGIPLNGLKGGQIRILILDPDLEWTQTLKAVLTARNDRYQVYSSDSVFGAGLLAAKEPPEVMFVDVLMPQIQVQSLCRLLRSSDELCATKLVATGRGLSEAQGEAYLRQGFERYLSKPVDLDTVVQTIEDAISVIT